MICSSKQYLIAPSILSADFARLGEEVEKVLASGADVIHFDVMDNHYVPNLTFGSMICKALRGYGITAPIDVHLMVTPVDGMIEQFLEAGASVITFHLDYVMDKVDQILLMSVNPGFGGQSFIESTLDKVRDVRKLIDASGRNIRLEVDGGIKANNIRTIAEAGADMLVAGSAIFNQGDYLAAIDAMRQELALVNSSTIS